MAVARKWSVNATEEPCFLHRPGEAAINKGVFCAVRAEKILARSFIDLKLGGVSNETVRYGYGFCATRTIE
jgi:hypothetical protein